MAVPVAADTTSAASDVPCASCHQSTAAEFAQDIHHLAWQRQAHNAAETSTSAQCNACHQGSAAHMGAPTDPAHMNALREPTAAQTQAICGNCHQQQFATGALHAHRQADIPCTACHQTHANEAPSAPGSWPSLDAASTTCYGCHSDTFTDFARNETHRLEHGGVSCTSCHDPHQPEPAFRLGPNRNRVCGECHADKEGPFVFEHGASRVDGCTACHTPHGSSNRFMLTNQDVGSLCYSCHAVVPQFHLGFSPVGEPRFGEGAVCTNCHVTIHGSNLDRNFLR